MHRANFVARTCGHVEVKADGTYELHAMLKNEAGEYVAAVGSMQPHRA